MRNAQDILNNPAGVDAETLRKAHRALVKELHPDRNPDPKASEKLAEINAAYDLIKGTKAEISAQPEYTTGAARTRTMDEVMSGLRSRMNRENPRDAAEKAREHHELREKQRTSVFGAKKATREAEERAVRAADEKDRQSREWTGGQDDVIARRAARQDDIAQAQNMSNDPNDRSAFLRNLRNLRQARNTGQPMPEATAQSQTPTTEAAHEPIQPARPRIVPRRPGARPTNKALVEPKIVRESPVSDRMNTAMDAHLDKLQNQEARLNLMARRQGEARETAGLHKAQKIAVDSKGGLHIYMGSPAKQGQNYIVAPTFTTKDNTLTLGQPKIVSLNMEAQGAGKSGNMGDSLVSGGDRPVTLHFAAERQNLRQTAQKRDTDQR